MDGLKSLSTVHGGKQNPLYLKLDSHTQEPWMGPRTTHMTFLGCDSPLSNICAP